MTTIYGLSCSPNIKEGNIFLNERPETYQLILHKAILTPTIEQNFSDPQLEFVNLALQVAIINNLFTINKSCW